MKPGTTFFLQREPVGVCGLIIPWNVPLRMIAIKLGAALVVGNASCRETSRAWTLWSPSRSVRYWKK